MAELTNLTPRMMKAAMIQKAAKSSHTAPERAFNAYQKSRGMNLYWPPEEETHMFIARNGGVWNFQLDFVGFEPTVGPEKDTIDDIIKFDYEIDGEKFHSSDRQKQKDDWKDQIKAYGGVKVIHIPAAVTAKRFWPYLDTEIGKALNAKEMVIYIAG